MPNGYVMNFIRNYISALPKGDQKAVSGALFAMISHYDMNSLNKLGYDCRVPSLSQIDYDSVLSTLVKQPSPVIARVLDSVLGTMIKQSDFVRLANHICDTSEDLRTIWRLSLAYRMRIFVLGECLTVPSAIVKTLLSSQNSEYKVSAYKLLLYSTLNELEIKQAITFGLRGKKKKIKLAVIAAIHDAFRLKVDNPIRTSAFKHFLVDEIMTAIIDDDLKSSAEITLELLRKSN